MTATITLHVNIDDNSLIISERDAFDMFKDMTDDAYDDIEIFGMTFSPSVVLATDAIAEREMFLNYLDSEWLTFEDVPFDIYYHMSEHEIDGSTLIIHTSASEGTHEYESN